MSVQRFKVILDGTTLHGRTVEEVAPALARLIHRDEAFAATLLQGKPITVKTGVDSATGGRYLEVLAGISVAAFLESDESEVREAPASAGAGADAQESPPSAGPEEAAPGASPAETPPHNASPPNSAAVPTSASGTDERNAGDADPGDADAAAAEPPPDEELYRAALGPRNAEHYLDFFRREDAAGRPLRSWHWPAFLTGGAWALYRRMYGWFLACFAVVVAPAALILAGVLSLATAWQPMLVAALGAWGAFAVYANSLYHRHVRRTVAQAKAGTADEARVLERLRREGGVNTWWLPWFLVGVTVMGTLTALSYQSYERRITRPKVAAVGRIVERPPTREELSGRLAGAWICAPVAAQAAGGSVGPTRVHTYLPNGTTPGGGQWIIGEDLLLYEQPPASAADIRIVPAEITWIGEDWTRFRRTLVGSGLAENCEKAAPQ